MDWIPFWPDQASNFSGQVDAIYLVLIGLSAFFTLPIIGLILYFSVKYRRGSSASRGGWRPGHWLEYGWIGGLLVLVVPVYFWGTSVYFQMFRPPPDPIEIYVVGKQWMWKTQHANGRREINQLHVPLGRPVKLIMTSQDVIHDFYVPAFRVKHDVIPGRYTSLWFEATKEGRYHLFCSEYCGTEHSGMVGEVIVMDPADFQAWLNEGALGARQTGPLGTAMPTAASSQITPGSMAEAGAVLFERAGCISCHQMGGGGVGPSLVGVYGTEVQLQSGATVQADEEYIRESIVEPNAKIVAGYQPIMPSFTGQFTDEELMQVVAYVKSLAASTDGNAGSGGPNVTTTATTPTSSP